MSKGGRKFVMLCRKAKTAERKGIARNFLPPPARFSPPREDISSTTWEKSAPVLSKVILTTYQILKG